MAEVTGEIRRLLDPILASLGLSLWELDFRKSGPRWLLRVFIDRTDGGVTLEDCVAVSRDLSATLDVEDIIAHTYTIEVSSPGLDRALTTPEHFDRFAGSMVRVKTFQPINGQKVFVGRLLARDGEQIAIELEAGTRLEIPLREITKAALEVEF